MAEVSTTNQYNDGAWHHGVAIYNGTLNELSLYIDGVSDATAPLNIAKAIGNKDFIDEPWTLGARHCSDFPLKNLLDEVKIWNYALTAEQVQTEYSGGAVRFGD